MDVSNQVEQRQIDDRTTRDTTLNITLNSEAGDQWPQHYSEIHPSLLRTHLAALKCRRV